MLFAWSVVGIDGPNHSTLSALPLQIFVYHIRSLPGWLHVCPCQLKRAPVVKPDRYPEPLLYPP